MAKPIIGILTWREGTRFQEPKYFRSLVREGERLGAIVFIFSHRDVLGSNEVRGFIPEDEGTGWKSCIFPRPDAVIDRCRRKSPGAPGFRKRHPFLFVNSTYTNKWNATRLFAGESSIKKWIPKTMEYSPHNLANMLKEHEMLYVKPGNGTGGRSIVKIARKEDGYELLGRTRNQGKKKKFFNRLDMLTSWNNKWVEQEKIRNGIFMIQQGLNLELLPNRVADMRMLIQKNEMGKWEVTGYGMRVGDKNSPTSNLHGGGNAADVDSILETKFGAQKAKSILSQSRRLAYSVAKTVENHFGRMMELGLDIGVDVNGRVWLIEVNPKPGREVFRKMGKMHLYRKAVQRPLQYAMYLIKDKTKGRQIKVSDIQWDEEYLSDEGLDYIDIDEELDPVEEQDSSQPNP